MKGNYQQTYGNSKSTNRLANSSNFYHFETGSNNGLAKNDQQQQQQNPIKQDQIKQNQANISVNSVGGITPPTKLVPASTPISYIQGASSAESTNIQYGNFSAMLREGVVSANSAQKMQPTNSISSNSGSNTGNFNANSSEHSRNQSDSYQAAAANSEQQYQYRGSTNSTSTQGGGGGGGSSSTSNNFFSQRSNHHTPSNSNSNIQLEKLKQELAKVKKHNSKSRSQSRNGLGSQSIKSVSANLKNEIISRYKAQPDQPMSFNAGQGGNGNGDKQQSMQGVISGGGGNQSMQFNAIKSQQQPQQQQQQRGLSRSSSNVILQQTLLNNEKCLNTKVFARFRPLNKIEVELTKNDVGTDCCLYPDEKTVVLMPESTVFTMDYVFDPNASQHRVYEEVGSETITDVMNGYNGTIFAYGQTGSGKTYSMFGDIYKKNLKGLIPRSIEHIFKTINSCDVDIEFILTCSMLEIYKENLHDLLCIQKADLKIKESPMRGIYVEGLTQLCVGTENELITMLELGEQARKVAATRINQYSSRSHTIFMLEIKQRYANDTEKKGKLNLVDLAGSEKVGKTGAMGDILEEAKKINLSLSCLGNVIHSLTTNSEHIPYRDSKLTRILQESLGGNFKTSLLVTCSSHSSSLEETLSTLKFATRAKSIKNHFKMNIKNSPEALQKIIQQLKRDLMDAKSELDVLKKSNDIAIPCEETIHVLPQNKPFFNKSSATPANNSAQVAAVAGSLVQKQDPATPANSALFDDVHKHIMLREKIEGQSSELNDLRCLLKEQDAKIQRQEQQIEKLKKENFQLSERLSQSQQDKEVMHSKMQSSSISSEKAMEDRIREITQIERSVADLNKIVSDLVKEKNESISQQLAKVTGGVDSSIYLGILSELSNGGGGIDAFVAQDKSSSDPLLRVKTNLHSTLKDIKQSISSQRISSRRLREIAKKIELQFNLNMGQTVLSENNQNKQDASVLHLLFYETLLIENVHTSLEYSVRSLEIQEALNFQKQSIVAQKYSDEVKTSNSLQAILQKAMKTHAILRERIDHLEEDSAKHEENLLTEQASTIMNIAGSPEKKRYKIIHSVQHSNANQQLLQPSTNAIQSKDVTSQMLDMLQDWFLDELSSHAAAAPTTNRNITNNNTNNGKGFEAQVDAIKSFVHSYGLQTTQVLSQRVKEILGKEQSEGLATRIQGENQSISRNIYVSENNRLRDKILVLMSELDLSSKKSEILEEELKKKSMEVVQIEEIMRRTCEQSEKFQREEFNKLRKQVNESNKPFYQEILDFFKRQNANDQSAFDSPDTRSVISHTNSVSNSSVPSSQNTPQPPQQQQQSQQQQQQQQQQQPQSQQGPLSLKLTNYKSNYSGYPSRQIGHTSTHQQSSATPQANNTSVASSAQRLSNMSHQNWTNHTNTNSTLTPTNSSSNSQTNKPAFQSKQPSSQSIIQQPSQQQQPQQLQQLPQPNQFNSSKQPSNTSIPMPIQSPNSVNQIGIQMNEKDSQADNEEELSSININNISTSSITTSAAQPKAAPALGFRYDYSFLSNANANTKTSSSNSNNRPYQGNTLSYPSKY